MKKKSYALMQPSFIPWMGWFALMNTADIFVIFDDAQFSKQSWHQRNFIKTKNGKLMLTVPVKRNEGKGLIKDTFISDARALKKMVGSIKQNYIAAPFFKTYIDDIVKIFTNRKSMSLLDFNMDIILWVKKTLGISGELLFSSSLELSGRRGEYISNMGQFYSASKYLSPMGSHCYLRDEVECFNSKGIEVEYLAYKHPEYSQVNGDFLPYLSILDLIFNVGGSSALNILCDGIHYVASDKIDE